MDPFRKQFSANLNRICDRISIPKSGAGRATILAGMCSMSVPAAHKWLTGGSLPELDKLPRICTILKCTTDELILGRFEPEDIVRIHVEMSGGRAVSEMTIDSQCFSQFGTGPFALLQVESNEMEPFVMEGDFVFYDTSRSSVDRSGVYVIDRHGRKFVRRIQRSMNEHISLYCDNPLFAEETIDMSCGTTAIMAGEFHSIGMVVARILVKR